MKPDELLTAFAKGMRGATDVDMHGVLFDIIADIQDSFRLAMSAEVIAGNMNAATMGRIDGTVIDYITNHYGD